MIRPGTASERDTDAGHAGWATAPVALALLHSDWTIRSINAAARRLGLAEGDDLLHAAGLDRNTVEPTFADVPHAAEFRAVAGATLPPCRLIVSATENGWSAAVVGSGSTRELEESRQRLDGHIEKMPLAAIEWSPDRRVRRWNPAAERIFGFAHEEFGERDAFPLIVPPESRNLVDRVWEALLRQSGGESSLNTNVTKDGRTILCRWYNTPIRNSEGHVVAVASLAEDITERETANRELRASQRRLAAVVRQLPLLVWAFDHDGTPVFWNDHAASVTGLPRSHVVGVSGSLDALFRDPNAPASQPRSAPSILAPGSGQPDYDEREIQIATTGGGSRTIAWTALSERCPIPGWAGWGVGIDVTERLRARAELEDYQDELERLVERRTAELQASHEQLEAAERMAALGELSAGIGHDLANMLLPIRCRLDAIVARGPESQDHAETAEDVAAIGAAIGTLERLGRDLRALARDPAASDRAVTDVASWWPPVKSMLHDIVQQPSRLETEIDPAVETIAAPPQGLTQALVNLVTNAAEALEGAVRPGTIRVAVAAGGPRIAEIMVTDDGPGMSPRTRHRALDPFFTTKTRGVSTGLGLAIVAGIARRAGGRVEIDSVDPTGTTVRVLLPRPPAADQRRVLTAVVSCASPRVGALFCGLLETAGVDVRLLPPDGPNTLESVPRADLAVVDADLGEERLADMIESQIARSVVAVLAPNGAKRPTQHRDDLIYVAADEPVLRLRAVLSEAVEQMTRNEPDADTNDMRDGESRG